jgi:3-dehydroquinate dehydratase
MKQKSEFICNCLKLTEEAIALREDLAIASISACEIILNNWVADEQFSI